MNDTTAALFDPAAGQAAAAEGIEASANAAPRWFRQAADGAIAELVEKGEPFTTDDLWDVLNAQGWPISQVKGQAAGGVMRTAAADGLIVKTDRVRASRMASCHRRPKTVWVVAARK